MAFVGLFWYRFKTFIWKKYSKSKQTRFRDCEIGCLMSWTRYNTLLICRKSVLKDKPILVKDKPLDEDLVQKESSVVEKNDSTEEGSSWCQPVYFNYKCYSASFLSRARLAGLPKKVGPGTFSSHVFTNPEFLFVIVSLIFLGFFL